MLSHHFPDRLGFLFVGFAHEIEFHLRILLQDVRDEFLDQPEAAGRIQSSGIQNHDLAVFRRPAFPRTKLLRIHEVGNVSELPGLLDDRAPHPVDRVGVHRDQP